MCEIRLGAVWNGIQLGSIEMNELSEATLTAIKTAKESRAAALTADSVHKAAIEKSSLTTQDEQEKALNVTTTKVKADEDAKAALAALATELGMSETK